MAVQHGHAARLVVKAVQFVGAQAGQPDFDFDTKLISGLYKIRADYVAKLGMAYLDKRYTSEQRDALQELGNSR
jgi:hypothetical protein